MREPEMGKAHRIERPLRRRPVTGVELGGGGRLRCSRRPNVPDHVSGRGNREDKRPAVVQLPHRRVGWGGVLKTVAARYTCPPASASGRKKRWCGVMSPGHPSPRWPQLPPPTRTHTPGRPSPPATMYTRTGCGAPQAHGRRRRRRGYSRWATASPWQRPSNQADSPGGGSSGGGDSAAAHAFGVLADPPPPPSPGGCAQWVPAAVVRARLAAGATAPGRPSPTGVPFSGEPRPPRRTPVVEDRERGEDRGEEG